MSRSKIRCCSSALAALLLAQPACSLSVDDSLEGAVGNSQQAIAGQEGGVEWAIDAPWRMEPIQFFGTSFEPVPIVFSMHDASMQTDAVGPSAAISLRRFCGLVVVEIPPASDQDPVFASFQPGQLHEVEKSAKWPYSSDAPLELRPGSFHYVKKLWKGDTLDAADLNFMDSAEWSATVLYTPSQAATGLGKDLKLQVVAIVSPSDTCPPLPAYPSEIVIPSLALGGHHSDILTGLHYFTNILLVHYGEAALPRFPGGGWAYGDIHYHSQGTDNEGEAGYSYRAVSKAMKAMGMDFVFASEHASDSGQVTDVDAIFVEKLPDFIPDWLEDLIIDWAKGIYIPVESRIDAQRDMSPRRFAHLLDWLRRADGVNQEVLSGAIWPFRAPQIFLGGEVDVIPEISESEKAAGYFTYGSAKKYPWAAACAQIPSELRLIQEYIDLHLCDSPLTEEATEHHRFLLHDVQGRTDTYFARQHLVHLPSDPTNAGAFVSSNTTFYGGAKKRLLDVLRDDYQLGGKGVAFLAHPVAAASGSGYSRLGPDIVPYSDVQLRTAFESPHVLGLQLWNEDAHVDSDFGTGFPMVSWMDWASHFAGLGNPFRWERQNQDGLLSSLHNGATAWDKMLLWGINPAKTAGLEGLVAGVRRVYMAGGSDAHGDLNFRREGAFFGWDKSVDTALGKPRNLVFVGQSRPVTVSGVSGMSTTTIGQEQVVDGFRSGNFLVTDGPIVRITLDLNASGTVDNLDRPMGSVSSSYASAWLPILVEWISTPEFGPIQAIDLYVGVDAAPHAQGLVYAPLNHAVRGKQDPQGAVRRTYTDSTGKTYKELYDGYLLDPSGKLRVPVPSAQAHGGTKLVWLNRADYRLITRSCTPTTECFPPDESHLKPYCITHETCTASNVKAPERVYVRAFARAQAALPIQGTTATIERLAYTNPIWVQFNVLSTTTIVSTAR